MKKAAMLIIINLYPPQVIESMLVKSPESRPNIIDFCQLSDFHILTKSQRPRNIQSIPIASWSANPALVRCMYAGITPKNAVETNAVLWPKSSLINRKKNTKLINVMAGG